MSSKKQFHVMLLLSWVGLGLILRFLNLGEKSASSIEISTLVFSLGQGLKNIPLDQVISSDILLSPLRFDSTTQPQDVIQRLMSESNHPPLYFLLNHFWMKLFSTSGEIVSLTVARSLSSLLGILSIPAIFGLSYFAFRSLIIAQITAALMAVSPYGIYLAQEARHYTLTILWILTSLTFFVKAIRSLNHDKPLPIWMMISWIIINGLGIATHYFYVIFLGAEAFVLVGFWLRDWQNKSNLLNAAWVRIYAVVLGTLATGLVWVPILQNLPNDQLTDWIEKKIKWSELFNPIFRLLAWFITMILMLPVEGTPIWITVISAIILIGVLVKIVPAIVQGMQSNLKEYRLETQIFGGVVITAIALFLILIYGLNKDVSLAARYQFIYFPALIILIGSALGTVWKLDLFKSENEGNHFFPLNGKKLVILTLIMGCFGALTVVSDYGYQKSQQADLLAELIINKSKTPVLIATTHRTHAETRALIGLGLEFQRQKAEKMPQFMLVKKSESPSPAFATALNQVQRPFELWTVNLKESLDFNLFQCQEDIRPRPDFNGYRYRRYYCR